MKNVVRHGKVRTEEEEKLMKRRQLEFPGSRETKNVKNVHRRQQQHVFVNVNDVTRRE